MFWIDATGALPAKPDSNPSNPGGGGGWAGVSSELPPNTGFFWNLKTFELFRLKNKIRNGKRKVPFRSTYNLCGICLLLYDGLFLV